MKPRKVLLCFEKYCDMNPDMKLTNSYHNFLNTFSQSRPNDVYHVMHYDESLMVYGVHIDSVLPAYCKAYGIESVMFILLGGQSCNPSNETFRKLKEAGVFLCFHWPDTGPGWGTNTIQEIGELADLNISWDNPRSQYHDSLPPLHKYQNMWVPQDPNFFFNRDPKDIDASFVGSCRYPDRQYFLGYLKEKNPKFLICGGQREESLSPEKYAEMIRRSKIVVNFSASPAGFWQTKGRIFEAFASGGMLLEYSNPSTAKLFTAGVDYIEFSSKEELVESIDFYTKNPDIRDKIALSGYNKFMNNYTAQHFWDSIMENVNTTLDARQA